MRCATTSCLFIICTATPSGARSPPLRRSAPFWKTPSVSPCQERLSLIRPCSASSSRPSRRDRAPDDRRPGAYPLGSTLWLIGQVDIRDRHRPPPEHERRPVLRLEYACRACSGLADPTADFCNAKAMIEPLNEDRLQASQRRLSELDRVLQVIGCHREKVFSLQLRVVILPGDQHPQHLPAGQVIHPGRAALRAARWMCLCRLVHGSPSSLLRRTAPTPKRAWIAARAASTRCCRASCSGVGAGGTSHKLSWRGGAPRLLTPTPISRTG